MTRRSTIAVTLILLNAPNVRAQSIAASCSNTGDQIGDYFTTVRIAPLVGPDSSRVVSFGDVAVSPSGRILIVDTGDYNVKVFESDGQFLRVLGSRGIGVGQLQHPAAAAFLNDSTVIVADDSRLRQIRFSTHGGVLEEGDLPLRPVGGITAVGGVVWAAGLGPVVGGEVDGPPRALHRLNARGVAASHIVLSPELMGQPPLRARQVPLVAAHAGNAGPRIFLTGRLSDALLEVSPTGEALSEQPFPAHPSFVDPELVVSRLADHEMGDILHRTSPVVRVIASEELVVVTYFASQAGDARLRYHVLDGEMDLVAAGLLGPAIYAVRGDSLFALVKNGEGEAAGGIALAVMKRCAKQ